MLAAPVLATSPGAWAMRLRRPNYGEQQALVFVAACALLGAPIGVLWVWLRGER